MTKKWNKRWIVLILMLLGLMLPMTSALADCQTQSSNGDDDVVLCANPADTNGIYTGGGNDTITVNADTQVSATSSRTIDTGLGDDVVTNRGTASGVISTFYLDQGNDTFYNYGMVTSGDHAARCFPQAGQTCTLHNYSTIHTDGEALDIVSTGGHTVIYNSGTITSDTQEPMHVHGGTSQITNTGTLAGRRQAIEVYEGSTIIVNEGTATAVDFAAIDTHHLNDDVTNRGYVRSETMQAIMTAGGNDTIRHYGTAVANNLDVSGAVIDGGRSGDTIIAGGDITEIGNGTAAIRGGSGSDTIIIEGGVFNRVIDGDEYADNGYTDVLIFRFTGTQAEIDAFKAAMVGKVPSSGSVVWRGNTYQWDGFEQLKQELTVSSSTTATPTNTPISPTNTPVPTNAPTSTPIPPTNTPVPTNTAQPTNTSVPPTATQTNTPQPSNTPSGTILGVGLYQENHAWITYTGAWVHENNANASGGSLRYTNQQGAQASFQFNGSKLTLIRALSPNYGSMQVCIDGGCQTVSNYNPTVVWQSPVSFTVADGTHSVTITNPSTTYFDLDAVRIETTSVPPTATSTPIPTNTPQPTSTSVPPTATATAGCPPSVPAGVTAQRHDPTSGSRNLRLQFEDVGTNACMGVTHYVVYAWSGSYSQQWTFNRSDITCTSGSCFANITLPSTLTSAYWRVEAYNALGTGGSDNSKRWTY
jgi:hypothetical protein